MANVPDIYFLPEWGKYFETQEEQGKWTMFEFKNDLGHINYQFIARPVPVDTGAITYYDIITPYGFSGPIVLECQEGKRQELVAEYDSAFQQYCEENNIVTEYVRFNPWIQNVKNFEHLYSFRNNGDMIYIDLTVEDFFMDEFSPKSRTQVRKAQKNNVEIELDFTGETVGEFHRLYDITAKRNGINNDYYLFSEEFFQKSFEIFKGKQFLLNAKYEGEYISSSLILHYGDYMHSHLTANDPDYFHLAANSLIQYEACRWGIENNKKEFQLGGTAPYENLHRFKKGFTKTKALDLVIGKKIRLQKTYDQLVDRKMENGGIKVMGYFPLYRG
ncbi:hypothetical protein BBH88_07570 [Planococcus antarcticus DSM 14505]|uniref:BioF2-like acetyltransferase domain-containing protein n=1 Tax=Planococcus antarcticus DSM 14505 TaxID=1185653 RepID=A0ABN4RIE9_9BACL|nr:GNAT family N-acetyltransferase [Planococcus antarcticus]ANU10169.1 hypothetical protein BBH88_07570 [Planococcus antarcticus DSM 14505]